MAKEHTFKVRLRQSFAVGEVSWPGKVAALWFGLIDPVGIMKNISHSDEYGKYESVAALVAECCFLV